MDKYTTQEKLGDGTYGVVIKGINTKNNEYVAIKKMKKKYTNWEDCINLNEIKSLISFKHPNIVTLNELILTKENELNLIFEFIGLNLYEYSIRPNKELAELDIRNIIYQILQGLAYMHKNNYFHRDMKPENILINEVTGDVKIADFGLAKEIKAKPPHTDYVATRWYRSPEVILKCKNYNYPIDIFAVGAIMAELYNNKPLFPGKNEQEQMGKICEMMGTPTQSDWPDGHIMASKINYKFPNFKGYKLKSLIPRASDNSINLLESMLNFNPLNRPNAQQCLQHPFFQCHNILSLYGIRINDKSSQTVNNNLINSFNNSNINNISVNKLSNSNITNSINQVSTTPIRISSMNLIASDNITKNKNSSIFTLANLKKTTGLNFNSNTHHNINSSSMGNN